MTTGEKLRELLQELRPETVTYNEFDDGTNWKFTAGYATAITNVIRKIETLFADELREN